MIKKLVTLFITLVLALTFNAGALMSVSASEYEFDQVPVTSDLTSLEKFSFLKYPYKDGASAEVINIAEFCYSAQKNNQVDYALYIYVYNPSKLDINIKSSYNKIQLAITEEGKDTDEYNKFSLIFCNKSEGDYDNLFYKFRVNDPDGILLRTVNSAERRYKASGVELIEYGEQLAVDYTIGGSWYYTGYAKGYGPDGNAESTLACETKKLETVKFDDLKATSYKTGISSLGAGHQNEITSVMFSVPNRLAKDYGKLQRIMCEFYEYKTTPIIVTAPKTVGGTDWLGEALKPYVGVDINATYGGYTSNLGYGFSTGYMRTELDGNEMFLGDYVYNTCDWSIIGNYGRQNNFFKFSWLLPVDEITQAVSEARLKDYLYNYKKGDLSIRDNTLSTDLLTTNVDEGRKAEYNKIDVDADDLFDLRSYSSTHNWWQGFLDFGFHAPTADDRLNVSPIYEVTEDDVSIQKTESQISKDLLIDKYDVRTLRDMVSQAKLTDKTVVLFRYAVTDYYSVDLYVQNHVNEYWSSVSKNNEYPAYLATKTMFLNFDIIQLTYSKQGELTVIPVVSNPIDILGKVTSPPKYGYEINWIHIAVGGGAVILLLANLLNVVTALGEIAYLPIRIFKAIAYKIKKSNHRRK